MDKIFLAIFGICVLLFVAGLGLMEFIPGIKASFGKIFGKFSGTGGPAPINGPTIRIRHKVGEEFVEYEMTRSDFVIADGGKADAYIKDEDNHFEGKVAVIKVKMKDRKPIYVLESYCSVNPMRHLVIEDGEPKRKEIPYKKDIELKGMERFFIGLDITVEIIVPENSDMELGSDTDYKFVENDSADVKNTDETVGEKTIGEIVNPPSGGAKVEKPGDDCKLEFEDEE